MVGGIDNGIANGRPMPAASSCGCGGPGAPATAGAMGSPTASVQGKAGAQALGATPPPSGAGGDVRIASFNVLGSSHTDPGGNKRGWRRGTERVPGMVAALREHRVDVAGLQEFQPDQQRAFAKAAPEYDMRGERDNVVAWRKDRFRLVQSRTLTIPYFEGSPRRMPVVQLEDRRTGQRAWYVNVHNPADTKAHPRNAANRAEAVRREQALLDELRATGLPVFLVGDFNDRSLRSSFRGASASDPAQGRDAIDWIFGSSGVRFSDSTIDASPREERTSDHPIVVTTAHL